MNNGRLPRAGRPTEPLFSYGTLQDEAVQRSCYGRILVGTPDRLSFYRRSTLVVSDPCGAAAPESYPVIDPSGNRTDQVAGMVFHLTGAELEATDRYEGREYRRAMLRLDSGLQAWVYLRRAQHRPAVASPPAGDIPGSPDATPPHQHRDQHR